VRLGGHFVQGHVDGVGRVTRLDPEGENWWFSVLVPENLRRYIAEKGSLAIDGISLTVAGWKDGVADIAIIPFTYEQTNVRSLAAGDVNLETDILAKYVESLLEARQNPASRRWTIPELIEEGF
jgi:riboflavin synthase